MRRKQSRPLMSPTLPHVLLTRPERDARALAGWIGGRAHVVISPLMRIEPVGGLPDLAAYGGVIFTSRNGVAVAGAGAGRVAHVVGERTAKAAQDAGWRVDHVASDAQTLCQMLIDAPPKPPLLHLRGEQVRGSLAARLTAAGIETQARIVYRQPAQMLTKEARAMLSGESRVILPLFSPRSAALLARQGPFSAVLDVVALSQAVADAAQVLRPKAVAVADRPDLAAMQAALSGRLDAVTPP